MIGLISNIDCRKGLYIANKNKDIEAKIPNNKNLLLNIFDLKIDLLSVLY